MHNGSVHRLITYNSQWNTSEDGRVILMFAKVANIIYFSHTSNVAYRNRKYQRVVTHAILKVYFSSSLIKAQCVTCKWMHWHEAEENICF